VRSSGFQFLPYAKPRKCRMQCSVSAAAGASALIQASQRASGGLARVMSRERSGFMKTSRQCAA
jgi:hypothetical protein